MDRAQYNTELTTCGFDLQRDFTEKMNDVESFDLPWKKWSAESLSADITDDNSMVGWRTAKLEYQSRYCPPDKIKKRRRNYLLRLYAHHDCATEETRSDRYVFVHHENWRQYMKQYRKYYTVGHAGRVNCEDLEWKHLLRHINISETLKELLFNSSTPLHPIPTLPTVDHRRRNTNMNTMMPPSASSSTTAIDQQRPTSKQTPPTRNIFQSFKLASVKQRKDKKSSLLWMKNECKSNDDHRLRESQQEQLNGTARPKSKKGAKHAGKMIKLLKEDDDEKEHFFKYNKKEVIGTTLKRKPSKSHCSNQFQTVDKITKARSIRSRGFISEMRVGVGSITPESVKNTVSRSLSDKPHDNRDSESVLSGSHRNGEPYNDVQFTLFKTDGLGSLRLENGGKKGKKYGNNKRLVENLLVTRKNMAPNFLTKDFKGKLSTIKSKRETLSPARILTDGTQHISIINYGSLSKIEPMKVLKHRQSSDNTPRFAEQLPVQTVICGNKYGTAEEHESRLWGFIRGPLLKDT